MSKRLIIFIFLVGSQFSFCQQMDSFNKKMIDSIVGVGAKNYILIQKSSPSSSTGIIDEENGKSCVFKSESFLIWINHNSSKINCIWSNHCFFGYRQINKTLIDSLIGVVGDYDVKQSNETSDRHNTFVPIINYSIHGRGMKYIEFSTVDSNNKQSQISKILKIIRRIESQKKDEEYPSFKIKENWF